jgi:putative ABC transport system permease protein
MFVIKNALLNLMRSKVRTILILITVFVIVASCSITLAIQNAANEAEKGAIEGKTINAQIVYNRQLALENMSTGSGVNNRERASEINSITPTISAIKKYANLNSVKDFYYTKSISLNGKDIGNGTLTAISSEGTAEQEEQTEAEKEAEEKIQEAQEQMEEAREKMEENREKQEEYNSERSEENSSRGGMGQGGGGNSPALPNFDFNFNFDFDGSLNTNRSNFLQSGDFNIIGYSSYSAMTNFIDGSLKITAGKTFSFNDKNNECIISNELATFNKLTVGSIIGFTNPSNAKETYRLKVSGIFEISDEEAAGDVSNQIYIPYKKVNKIISKSKENKIAAVNSFGTTTTSILLGTESNNFVFSSKENYDKFLKEVESKLSEGYTIQSEDASSYENSLIPIKNLSKFANVLLWIILGIGIIVLIVINIFNIRERKYEIGVLTAIGMRKAKVAKQFIFELLCIAIIAIILGTTCGAISSVPVSNALLKSQVESVEKENSEKESNFGRPTENGTASGIQRETFFNENQSQNDNSYISKINARINLTVLFELILIGILITIFSSFFAILSILKYDPLEILANRS